MLALTTVLTTVVLTVTMLAVLVPTTHAAADVVTQDPKATPELSWDPTSGGQLVQDAALDLGSTVIWDPPSAHVADSPRGGTWEFSAALAGEDPAPLTQHFELARPGVWTLTATFTPTGPSAATTLGGSTTRTLRVLPRRPFELRLTSQAPLPAEGERNQVLSLKPRWTGSTPAAVDDVTLTTEGECSASGGGAPWTLTLGDTTGTTCLLTATAPGLPGQWSPTTLTHSLDVQATTLDIVLTVPPTSTVGRSTTVKATVRAVEGASSVAVPGTGSVTIRPPGASAAVQVPVLNGLALGTFTPDVTGSWVATVDFTPAQPSRYRVPVTAPAATTAVDRGVHPLALEVPIPRQAVIGSEWTAKPLPDPTGVQPTLTGIGNGCTAEGLTVTFTSQGACQITVSRAASDQYAASALPTQSVTVTLKPVSVSLSTDPEARVGRLSTLKATATTADGDPVPGTFTFSTSYVNAPGGDTLTDSDPAGDLFGVTWQRARTTVVRALFTPSDSTYATVTHDLEVTPTRGLPTLVPPAALRATMPSGREIADATVAGPDGALLRPEVLDLNTSRLSCEASGANLAGVRFEAPGTCKITWTSPITADWEPATLERWITVQPNVSNLSAVLVPKGASAEASQPPSFRVDRVEGTAEHELRIWVRDGAEDEGTIPGQVRWWIGDHAQEAQTARLDEDHAWDQVADLPLAQEGSYTVHLAFQPSSGNYQPTTAEFEVRVERRTPHFSTLDVLEQAYAGDIVDPGFTLFDDVAQTIPLTRAVSYTVTGTAHGLPVCEAVASTGVPAAVPGDNTHVRMLRAGTCQVSAHALATGPLARVYKPHHAESARDIQVVVSATSTTLTSSGPATVGAPHTLSVVTTQQPRSGTGASGTVSNTPVAGSYRLFVVTSAGAVREVPVQAEDSPTGTRLTWLPDHASSGGGDTALRVDFEPVDPVQYLASSATTTVPVAPAATSVTFTVEAARVVATVTSDHPLDRSVLGGTVSFTAGGGSPRTVALDAQGRAVWSPHGIDPEQDVTVTAAYHGDTDHEPSTAADVRRSLPTISATASSGQPLRNGWHTAPVTVRFACAATAGPVVSCPSPVVLAADGTQQAINGTVTAADGGRAHARVSGLKIDRTAPSVRVGGVSPGATYRGTAPDGTCAATDRLSGVASCTVTTRPLGSGSYRVTATATDRAGHRTTASVTYRVLDLWIEGAALDGATFKVPRNRTVMIYLRAGSIQPQLMTPRRANRPPVVPGAPMVATEIEEGVTTWRVRFKAPTAFKKGQLVKVGIRTRKQVRVVRIRLT